MKDSLPQRKNIRLKYYDYSLEGYYFITICTKNRVEMLGNINVGVALQGDPKIKLSIEGIIVNKYIEECNKKLRDVLIDEYIIMPNHVHLIIILKNGAPRTAPPTIPKIINSLKSIITKEIGYSIWQRNYYEHVIRDEKEYLLIKQYIINNPYNWKDDKYY